MIAKRLLLGIIVGLACVWTVSAQATYVSVDGRVRFDYPEQWTAYEEFGNFVITDAAENNSVRLAIIDIAEFADDLAMVEAEIGEPLTAVTFLQLIAAELPNLEEAMQTDLGFSFSLPSAEYVGEYSLGDYVGAEGNFDVNPLYIFEIESGFLLVLLDGEDVASTQPVFQQVMETLVIQPFSFDAAAYTTPIITERADNLTLITQYQLPGFSVRAVIPIADGEQLIVLSGVEVFQIDVATSTVLNRFALDDAPLLTAAVSPDESLLATAGDAPADNGNNSFQLWDLATGDMIVFSAIDATTNVDNIGFSPDGSLLAVDAGALLIYDVATSEQAIVLERARDAFAFSPDGTKIAANCPRSELVLCVYSLETGDIVAELVNEGDMFPLLYDAVAFTPDGDAIVIGFTAVGSTQVDAVAMWDANTGALLHVMRDADDRGHRDSINALAFNVEGTVLVSAANDSDIRLWDVATGLQLAMLEDAHGQVLDPTVLAFSPDGTLLFSGGDYGTVRVWAVDAE